MSYIENLIADVNKTHSNFGQLVAVCQLAVKARKFLLVVSPSGCGKSTAMKFVEKNTPNSISPDRISIAALQLIADKLTGFRSAIFVDDITTTGTEYARRITLTTLTALVYSHRIESIMNGIEYTIEDFYGSAMAGIQPVMLRDLMTADEWSGSIQDKALRYYHLYRPIEPVTSLPIAQIENGLDFDSVKDFKPDKNNKSWRKLLELGKSQWSRARIREHMTDLLKAIAALEDRKEVLLEDYDLLLRLLKPMAIENVVVVKEQLEGERYLDNNLLALLTEYYSYGGTFGLAHISEDFHIKLKMAYHIMQGQNGWWQQFSKSPTLYRPSKALLEALKTYELEIEK